MGQAEGETGGGFGPGTRLAMEVVQLAKREPYFGSHRGTPPETRSRSIRAARPGCSPPDARPPDAVQMDDPPT